MDNISAIWLLILTWTIKYLYPTENCWLLRVQLEFWVFEKSIQLCDVTGRLRSEQFIKDLFNAKLKNNAKLRKNTLLCISYNICPNIFAKSFQSLLVELTFLSNILGYMLEHCNTHFFVLIYLINLSYTPYYRHFFHTYIQVNCSAIWFDSCQPTRMYFFQTYSDTCYSSTVLKSRFFL